MTEEINLDLATACNSETNSQGDAGSASVRPSADRGVEVRQPVLSAPQPVQNVSQERHAGAVEPSACAACRGERQLVYALGQLGNDFGSESALETFRQQMLRMKKNPLDPSQLHDFLQDKRKNKEPWHSPALLWTLEVGDLPLYVIKPDGPYDREAYERLEDYLSEQIAEEAEVVGVPGVITGQTRLYSGQQVPVINPDMRGFCNWSTAALIAAAQKAVPGAGSLPAKEKQKLEQLAEEFLDRIYFELRNAGRAPQERALNYAGTNLVQFMLEPGRLLEYPALDSISVERSTVFRPGSDCWDVTVAFFDPEQPPQSPRSMRRYTVDVSEVIPVPVGEPRSWKAR
jgi:cyanobactin maturation PatA/PatG family protease